MQKKTVGRIVVYVSIIQSRGCWIGLWTETTWLLLAIIFIKAALWTAEESCQLLAALWTQ